MHNEEIIQIIPAGPGWFTAHESEDPVGIVKMPIACWALTKIKITHPEYEDEDVEVIRPLIVDGNGYGLVDGNEDGPGGVATGKYLGIICPGEKMPCDIVMNPCPIPTHGTD